MGVVASSMQPVIKHATFVVDLTLQPKAEPIAEFKYWTGSVQEEEEDERDDRIWDTNPDVLRTRSYPFPIRRRPNEMEHVDTFDALGSDLLTIEYGEFMPSVGKEVDWVLDYVAVTRSLRGENTHEKSITIVFKIKSAPNEDGGYSWVSSVVDAVSGKSVDKFESFFPGKPRRRALSLADIERLADLTIVVKDEPAIQSGDEVGDYLTTLPAEEVRLRLGIVQEGLGYGYKQNFQRLVDETAAHRTVARRNDEKERELQSTVSAQGEFIATLEGKLRVLRNELGVDRAALDTQKTKHEKYSKQKSAKFLLLKERYDKQFDQLEATELENIGLTDRYEKYEGYLDTNNAELEVAKKSLGRAQSLSGVLSLTLLAGAGLAARQLVRKRRLQRKMDRAAGLGVVEGGDSVGGVDGPFI
jgi:hypothetical protein